MIRIYMVGGAVRDELLGLPVRDHDWVVVGATPEDMLAQGFRPVGKDFPVFLHPKSGEEYALARTERKSGRGYKGFAFHATPDVTLEQDLLRRDLTINAMARDRHGTLVDPHGGRQDLKDKLLRHVSPAFAEDPLRILRVARFAARFADFSIAPDTLALMRDIVAAGEIEHLVAERVWQEVARGLMEARPARMIRVLRDCGALARLAPELEALFASDAPDDAGEQALAALDRAAAGSATIAVRWACLLHRTGKDAHAARALSERLKAPNECRDLAVMLVREYATLLTLPSEDADGVFDVLQRTDAWRRPERFAEVLQALCHCADDTTLALRWQRALDAAQAVDAGAIAAACTDKILIPQRIRAARIAAIAATPGANGI